MGLEESKWLYDLYQKCGHILNEEERAIYFAYELAFVNEQIEGELVKQYKNLYDSNGLIRHSESLLELAYQRSILRNLVEDTTLKNEYSSIPRKKLNAMMELESKISREGAR